MSEDVSQVRKVFEIRSQEGGRVGSYSSLGAALAALDDLNATRDATTAYVVIEAYVTDFD